jgi:hypothetical protein
MGKRGGRREKRRLIVYSVVFLFIIVFYLTRTGDAPDARETLPAESPFMPREYEPLAKVDPIRLADVADGTQVERAAIERDALDHLLNESSKLVYGDLDLLGLSAPSREELLRDPAAWRGRPVTALGRLDWFEPDTTTDPHTFRGVVIDRDEQPWPFVVLHLPWDIDAGGVVRIKGFFLKHADMLKPDLSFASGPLIVGEELLPSSYPLDPVTELRPDLFDTVRDFDLGEASRPLESRSFFELLSFVQHGDMETLFGPPEEREPVFAVQLLNDTTSWRGRPVTTRGQLLHYQKLPLGPAGENPLGVPYAWQIWTFNYSGGLTYAISLEEPVGLVPEQDLVDIDGLYYRRFLYESGQNKPAMAAAIIAARVRRFVIPEDPVAPFIERAVLFTMLAIGVLIVFGQLVLRKQSRELRKRSVGRKKKLIQMPGLLHPQQPPEDGQGEDAEPVPGPPAPP